MTGPDVDSFQSWPGVVGTEPGYGSATTKAYAVAVEPIKVGDETAMALLAASAAKFKDQPGRVVELKQMLDRMENGG